jgi:predicted TIM-barrel fold metal-dependent hydrolase
MTKHTYKYIDPDLHVVEPKDLWQRYMKPVHRDRAPVGSDAFTGDMYLLHEGRAIYRQDRPPPMLQELYDDLSADNARTERFLSYHERGFGADVQIEAMDEEGIDMAVLYPTRGFYAVGKLYDDDIFAADIARAYNNWLAEFCAEYPDRLYGSGLVHPQAIDTAVQEARRMKEDLGFKSLYLRPNPVRGRNWNNPAYDPLWAECERLDLPIAFHEGWPCQLPVAAGERFDGRYEDLWLTEHVLCHPVEMMYALVCMIAGGVLERFPGLRVAFLEANCSWVPYLLWRLDEHYEHREHRVRNSLPKNPSAYFKAQCFVAVEADEHLGVWVASEIGDENLVFSTDFPHEDSRFPNALDTFLNLGFRADSVEKILWDNSKRLYNI